MDSEREKMSKGEGKIAPLILGSTLFTEKLTVLGDNLTDDDGTDDDDDSAVRAVEDVRSVVVVKLVVVVGVSRVVLLITA